MKHYVLVPRCDLGRIPEWLHRLSRLDDGDEYGRRRVFGADWHNYRTERASVTDVDRLEAALGTEIPSEFRDFLVTVGSGAGPYYGIYSVEQILQEVNRLIMEADDQGLPRPDAAKPFPISTTKAAEAHRKGYTVEQTVLLDGCIIISFQGCTYWSLLVVQGPMSGTVWDLGFPLPGTLLRFTWSVATAESPPPQAASRTRAVTATRTVAGQGRRIVASSSVVQCRASFGARTAPDLGVARRPSPILTRSACKILGKPLDFAPGRDSVDVILPRLTARSQSRPRSSGDQPSTSAGRNGLRFLRRRPGRLKLTRCRPLTGSSSGVPISWVSPRPGNLLGIEVEQAGRPLTDDIAAFRTAWLGSRAR